LWRGRGGSRAGAVGGEAAAVAVVVVVVVPGEESINKPM